MYMIEITEDKFEDAIEHLSKGIRCLSKGLEMFEEMKESSREEYNERSIHRYGGEGREDYNRDMYRAGGRYSRY